MKILLLDIETAPNIATVWSLFKVNVAINQLLDTSRVMCYSAQWLGESKVMFDSEYKTDHDEMIRGFHALLDEADAVVTYNGNSFDLPTANKEFLYYGLNPPSPYHKIDLYQVIKKGFRFASNKLDHISQELGLGSKEKHEGHQLWLDCMDGKPAAWKKMETYNKQDVALLEALYWRLLPWIKDHPNHGLYVSSERPVCTNCGCDKVQSRGVEKLKVGVYNRYQCTSCGTWLRGRFTLLDKEQGKKIITQSKL